MDSQNIKNEATKAAAGAVIGATAAHLHKNLTLPSHGAGAGAPAAKFTHEVVRSLQGGAGVGAALGAGATAAVGGPTVVAAATTVIAVAAPVIAVGALAAGVGYAVWKLFGDDR
jgi:hypothetical protein